MDQKVKDKVDEAVDEVVDDVVDEVLEERRDTEQRREHIDALVAADESPFDRKELEQMDPDAVAVIYEQYIQNSARANYAGRPSPGGGSTRTNSRDDGGVPAGGYANWKRDERTNTDTSRRNTDDDVPAGGYGNWKNA